VVIPLSNSLRGEVSRPDSRGHIAASWKSVLTDPVWVDERIDGANFPISIKYPIRTCRVVPKTLTEAPAARKALRPAWIEILDDAVEVTAAGFSSRGVPNTVHELCALPEETEDLDELAVLLFDRHTRVIPRIAAAEAHG
jgi:hypothetical protein